MTQFSGSQRVFLVTGRANCLKPWAVLLAGLFKPNGMFSMWITLSLGGANRTQDLHNHLICWPGKEIFEVSR